MQKVLINVAMWGFFILIVTLIVWSIHSFISYKENSEIGMKQYEHVENWITEYPDNLKLYKILLLDDNEISYIEYQELKHAYVKSRNAQGKREIKNRILFSGE